MENYNLIWLAGIIDGEGSIGIHFAKKMNWRDKNGYYLRPQILITNNNPFLLRRVSEIYTELNLRFYWELKKRKNPKHKETVVINLTSLGSCEKLIKNILPYLVAKRKQAEILLQFIELRKSKFTKNGGHNNSESKYSKEEFELQRKIKEANHKDYFLQRLQRKAHCPLDISNVKV